MDKEINTEEKNADTAAIGGLPPIAIRSIRNKTAISLQEPDRVPFMPSMNNFYALHYGVTIKDSMTDPLTLMAPLMQFLKDYDPDWVWNPMPFPIKPMETLGCSQTRWPGKYWNLPDNTPYQYIDRSFLPEDDWDKYLNDPTLFLIKNVFPQKYKALGGLAAINPYALTNQVVFSFAQFANPVVLESVKTMLNAGLETAEFIGKAVQLIIKTVEAGYPVYGAAPQCMPFDDFADNVRGLMELCMDVITVPEVVDEALLKWGDVTIPAAIANAKANHAEDIFIPLHCGFESFMSLENYEKHYWPPLKRMIEAVVEAGLTPIIFCEGKYDNRLECLTDVPKGKVLYNFEGVDFARAKKIVGPYAAIGGGMRSDMLMFGSPAQIEDETKKLLDILAPGGGYFMSNSIALEDVPKANMHAWRDTIEKYGKYR